LALLKLIIDLAHYVDWSGNQQASLIESFFKKIIFFTNDDKEGQ
jgi:hypothetical protein